VNNPPAFPLHNHGVQTLGMHTAGMTLRDYFAAKAIQGLLADQNPLHDIGEGVPMVYARGAYIYADAMLKAREA